MFEINKRTLPVKIHYFLLNGAHSGVIPFATVYAKQLGIPANKVGIIFFLISCLTLIPRTLLGGIVDHFQKFRTVLVVLIIIDIAADLGLNFIPRPYQEIQKDYNASIFCNDGTSYLIKFDSKRCRLESTNNSDCYSCTVCQRESDYCLKNSTSKSFQRNDSHNDILKALLDRCAVNNISSCNEACYGNDDCDIIIENNSLQLWMLSIFIGIIYMANGSIVSLSDAACFNALEDHPELYGRQRMFGTIGWGLFALLTGYLNQLFTGSSKTYNFTAGFYLLVILFLLDFPVVRKLKLKNAKLSKNICKDVGTIILKPKVLFLIIGIFLIGIATGISRSYVSWYYRTTLNANQLVIGLSSSIQCFLGELPFFFFSGWIINKLGHVNIFTLCFMAYGTRFLIYSYLYNPWIALPVELLQGPCFGSFYAAMTSYAKIVAPDGTEATIQGLLTGTLEGLGVATGSLLGGFAINIYGGRETFFWGGITLLLVGVLHFVIYAAFNYKVASSYGITDNAPQKMPVKN